MSRWTVITQLLGLQGWKVAREGVAVGDEEVVVRIERVRGVGYQCSRCGERTLAYYDQLRSRRVRDFPVWGQRCWVEFAPVRVQCRRCGAVAIEALDWIEPYQHLTLRYERYVAALCDMLPVLDVAELEGLSKETVYRLDRKWLARRKQQQVEKKVTLLGIDEIALRKGHHYATVFYDLERREVIGLVATRRERAVGGWFRRWGKAQCRGVEAVCMDLWSAYLNSVRRHCKWAVVVFDKFHVYGYLSAAIDEVRRIEQNKAGREGKDVLKGSRWLLLKNTENLRGKDKRRLQELMRLNHPLQQAHLLKEDFTQFYACANPEQAAAFLQRWTTECKNSGLRPFQQLARRLLRWSQGILAYFQHRITNAVSEGLNNKIKVLKRRAYGFHDMKYFFLKILNITGALPPLARFAHTNTE
jgi:transposase